MILTEGATFLAAKAVYDSAKKKSTGVKKTYETAKKVYAQAKMQYLQPFLTKQWQRWSNTTYQMLPERAFDGEILPTDLISTDYVRAVFSYNKTTDRLDAAFSVIDAAGDDVTGSTGAAKNLSNAANAAKNFAVKQTQRVRTPDPASGTQLSSVSSMHSRVAALQGKRKRVERPPTANQLLFKLTIPEEFEITKRESEGEDEPLPELWKAEEQGTVVPLPLVATPQIRSTLHGKKMTASALRLSANQIFTTICPSDGPTGASILNLDADKDTNADYFVGELQSLQIQLGSLVWTDNVWNAPLAQTDALQPWLTHFFVGLSATLTFQGASTSPYIRIVKLVLGITSGGSSAVVNFSSDLAVIATCFNLSTTTLEPVLDSQGFYVKSTGLLLALQTPDNFALALSDVFALIEIPCPIFLNSSDKLNLVTDLTAINAVWLCPAEDNGTTLRMTLGSDTTTAWFLIPLPGFSFKNCKLIATKQAYLQTAMDGNSAVDSMVTSGSIFIQSTTVLFKTIQWKTIIIVNKDSVDLILRWDDSQHDPLTDVLTWVQDPINGLGIALGDGFSRFTVSQIWFVERT